MILLWVLFINIFSWVNCENTCLVEVVYWLWWVSIALKDFIRISAFLPKNLVWLLTTVSLISSSIFLFTSPLLSFTISDSVVRTNYYKYYHPKEALIPNGILNRQVRHKRVTIFNGLHEDSDNSWGLTVNVSYIFKAERC